jgi:hypothetical protein
MTPTRPKGAADFESTLVWGASSMAKAIGFDGREYFCVARSNGAYHIVPR